MIKVFKGFGFRLEGTFNRGRVTREYLSHVNGFILAVDLLYFPGRSTRSSSECFGFNGFVLGTVIGVNCYCGTSLSVNRWLYATTANDKYDQRHVDDPTYKELASPLLVSEVRVTCHSRWAIISRNNATSMTESSVPQKDIPTKREQEIRLDATSN